jgi:hypothetical protein
MIEKLCKDVLDKLIFEFQKPDNREKINDTIINPIIYHIFKKLYPYILATSILLFLTFVLAFIMCMFSIKAYSNLNNININKVVDII